MIKKFLDLGYQPLANSYVLQKNLNNKEKNFKMPKKEPLVSKPAKKKFKFNNFWSK